MKKIALGMIAAVLTISAIAQTTNQNAGQNVQQQKEAGNRHFKGGHMFDQLNLSTDQKAQIKTVNETFKQQMQDLRKQGNITVDEQKQKRQALVKDRQEKIAAILTPDQRKQAEALKEQYKGKRDGARVERFHHLTKDLNLSPEQTAKVTSINKTFKANIESLKQNTSLSEDQKREEMKNLKKQHKTDVEALLTSDQKEQLNNRLENHPNRTAVK